MIEESTAKGPTGHLPDTFLTLKGWGKGVAYVNGFNLGWYWPSIGPQNNYFVPGPVLREGPNEVVLLEFERLKRDLTGGVPWVPARIKASAAESAAALNGHSCRGLRQQSFAAELLASGAVSLVEEPDLRGPAARGDTASSILGTGLTSGERSVHAA